jgi:hypothetical protein
MTQQESLISSYKEEIEQRLAVVRTKLGSIDSENELHGIAQIISLLNTNARSVYNHSDNTKRRELILTFCSSAKTELDVLLEENKKRMLFNTATKNNNNNNDQADGDDDDDVESNTKLLHNSRHALKGALDSVKEINNIGEGIQKELNSQDETIHRINQHVSVTNRLAGTARNIIRAMENKETRSKIKIYGGITLVVIVFIIAMYVMIFK